MTTELQQASLFELSGSDIQITYALSGIEGQPIFSYRDSNVNKLFSGDEIRSVDTEIGNLVTVTIKMDVDRSAETFTVIMPAVTVLPGSVGTHIQVLGITTTTPTALPGPALGQAKTYTQVNL